MNVILYSAEQLLSNGHAELIQHLYNAQMLLDEYLRESMHNGHTMFMDKMLFAIYIFFFKHININNVFGTVEDGDHFSSSETSDSSDSLEDGASKLSCVWGGGGWWGEGMRVSVSGRG